MLSETTNRILLAAPKSGSGKTTVTCALMQLLKDRGLQVSGFKCGPDYIDPMFHKKILGIDSRNLDSYFMKQEKIRAALSDCPSDHAVIEGVMGLYDGRDPGSLEGSAYEIAAITNTPILLVVDASGVGRTVISSIKGMLLDDTRHLIRGILLNQITEAFYEKLKPVLKEEIASMREDVVLLGFVPKSPEIKIGSRHLGLMLPEEMEDLREKLLQAASLVERRVDVDGLLSLMHKAGPVGAGADAVGDEIARKDKTTKIEAGNHTEKERISMNAQNTQNAQGVTTGKENLTLAVAWDEAFCFYYRDNLELFKELGVSIRFFSPLHDQALPEETDGILLGGGYPENYLETLSKNTSMLASIKKAIESGIPSLAECGGFMYLHKSIWDQNGNPFEMAGVINAECRWAGRLMRFGYLEVIGAQDEANLTEEQKKSAGIQSGIAGSMIGLRGHEFHYYESSDPGKTLTVAKPDHSKEWKCVISEKNGIWGFPHFYYPSAPAFAEAFVSLMKHHKNRQ